MSTADALPAAKPKHRSCDECRMRKLACSKDPTGCDRCKRENMACHYSEQKQMGRPRKRQHIEASRDEPVEVIESSEDYGIHGTRFPYENGFSVYGDPTVCEPNRADQSSFGLPPLPMPDGRSSIIESGREVWHFGDRQVVAGPPIDYGSIDFGSVEDDPMALLEPQLSTTHSNASTTASDRSSPQALPSPSCGCLAGIYLALAALQTLPTQIVPALRAVRGAASTAAQSIWCPQCGSVVLDNPNPPIEAFQNTMLLGTILPIIANGYHRLLKMVDDETDKAIADGSTRTFRFHEYGGMCGQQMDVADSIKCLEKEMFFTAVEMPPHQWRNTVRAMLRMDIYGHDQHDLKHKGLKDLVAEMEQRQIARHQLLDAWGSAGVHFTTMESGRPLCYKKDQQMSGNQPHACLQILQMAKISIDNLVIP